MEKELFKREYLKFMANKDVTKISVHIAMPDLFYLEVITNPRPNFEKKLEYYSRAYNEYMQLNTFNSIYIDNISAWDRNSEIWVNMDKN